MASSNDARVVALFEDVAVLNPRGRYDLELHVSSLKLHRQVDEFTILYKEISRMFILPDGDQPHAYVVLTLNSPIKKGSTSYQHIVLQFPTDETIECALNMSQELLETKYKDRVQAAYTGSQYDVFGQILNGLSTVKISRPRKFTSCQGGHAIWASFKAQEGVLYPLEKCFFFLPKPPTLILYDEIVLVETGRYSGGNSRSFDLILHMKNGKEHQFLNIKREEQRRLLIFLREKQLKIDNAGSEYKSGVGKALQGFHDEEEMDPHLIRIKTARASTEATESRKKMKKMLATTKASETPQRVTKEKHEVTSKSEVNPSKQIIKKRKKNDEVERGKKKDLEITLGSKEEDDEVKRVEKGGVSEVSLKESNHEGKEMERNDAALEVSPPKKRKENLEGRKKVDVQQKRKNHDENDKKKRRKKDPNEPKRALCGFIYFSQDNRETIKQTVPGISFKEMAKHLGERWKNMSAEEKEPYEAKAKADKERYKEQMTDFKGAKINSEVHEDAVSQD